MESINQALFLSLNADANTPLFIIKVAMFLAEWPVGVAILLAAFAVLQHDKSKIRLIGQVLLTVLVAMIITFAIRESWYHPRPFVLGLGKSWVSHAPTSSFPSFHGTFLFSLGFAMLHAATRSGRVIFLFILILGGLTAWARIYLGIHFPFDMLAAFIIALAALLTVSWLPIHKISYIN